MKPKKVLMITLLVLCCILCSCRRHRLPKPAADISECPYVDEASTGSIDYINGVGYSGYTSIEYVLEADELSLSAISNYNRGELVAYYVNDDRYVYFCQIEGLAPEQWLVRLTDDGHGHFSNKEACIMKAESVNKTPGWIEEIRKAGVEHSASSFLGPGDGSMIDE